LQLHEIKGFYNIPAKAQLVVASDVHIRHEEDERFKLLCELVRVCSEKGTKTFILNGDIFDFFFGWRSYFQNKYFELFSSLQLLSKSGCEVWFVVGNHEFAMDGMDQKFGFRLVSSEGAIWSSQQGRKILVAHGDLLKHDPKYMAFRSLVRSNFANLIAAMVPQKLLDLATLWFATTSRKKDKYRTLHHEKIIGLAKEAVSNKKVNDIIIGHFHHPYCETIGNESRLLSVCSWDVPSCLIMDEEGQYIRCVH
jgi:UDP-2,3-diacylglucosamine hydrolase